MSVTFSDLLTVLNKAPIWFWVPVLLMAFAMLFRLYVLGYAKTKLDTEAMDQLGKCQSDKAQLILWSSQAVRHFSGCGGCNSKKQTGNRGDLEKSYEDMMRNMK